MEPTDLLLNSFLGLSETVPDLTEVSDDAIGEQFADAQLAMELGRGGFQIVSGLQEAAEILEKQQAHNFVRSPAPARSAEVNDSHRLEKRDSHAWSQTRMATFGKSAAEVIDDWCEEFPHRKPEIEASLRAIAAELDAG